MKNSDAFRSQARAAFIRGRLREGLLAMAWAGGLVWIGMVFSTRPWQALIFGALLLVSSGIFAFVGRDAGRAVLPAMMAGSLPLVCALVGPHVGHACTGSRCVSFCVPLCALGGLGAGLLLDRFARAQVNPGRAWLFGIVIGTCSGAMGCACVGVAGIVAMLVGLVSPRVLRAIAV